jgi:cystathionine beta-lyase/cystathionine gamma-synthase
MSESLERARDICARAEGRNRFLGAAVPPVFQSSLFAEYEGKEADVARDGRSYTYTRMANPTVEIAESMIAELEAGETARCFSSGIAAVSAGIFSCLKAGDHAVCVRYAYGPSRGFLDTLASRFGISVTFIMGVSVGEFEAAVTAKTRLFLLESPCTYLFALQDVREVCRLAKARGITTLIDNTWATPVFQQPIVLGADFVAHSCSKYLGGHSDIVGGALVGRRDALRAITDRERALMGNHMDPFQAWLLLRGMRTLPLRMAAHQESALVVARWLEAHPRVARVLHPGLPSHPQHDLARRQMSGSSGVFTFFVKAAQADVDAMIARLRVFLRGPSWGGFESLIGGIGLDDEGARWAGCSSGGLRVSVGLERTESLLEDLEQALRGLP